MNLNELSDAELEAALRSAGGASLKATSGPMPEKQPDWQSQSTAERVAGRSARSAVGGAGALLDMPRIITDPVFGLIELGADALGADSVRDYARAERTAPSFSERFKGGFDSLTGGDYKPVGSVEQTVDTITEIGYSFLTPAMLQKLGQAGAQGLQKLGGYFNSGGKGVPKEYKKIVDVLRAEGKTDAEIIKIAKESQQSKAPTTIFEAAQSQKGTALQRSLTEEPSVAGNKMQAFNKQRVDDVIPAVVKAQSAKSATTESSYIAGQRAKETAAKLIADARKARLDATDGQYQKALQDIIPDQTLQQFAQDPVFKNALVTVEKEPAFQRLTQGMNKKSAGYWEYVYRHIRDKSGALKGSGDMTLSGAYGAAADDLKKTLDIVSSNLKLGREEFAALSPEVAALEKGLVGRIAKAKSPEKIGEFIMQESPEVISATKKAFLAKDPQAWHDITAAYINSKIDKATGLRAFLSSVDKNTITSNKLQAMMTPSQYKGHRLLVENLRRIEMGLPRNSETVSKAQAAAELAGGNLDEQIIQRIANNPNMRSQAADLMISAYRTGKGRVNAEFKAKLADALVSPDLEKLTAALQGKRVGSAEAIKEIDNFLLPYLGVAGEAQSVGSGSQRAISDASAQQQPQDDSISIESLSDEELQRALESLDQQSQNTPQDNNDILERIALAESGGNPNAKAATSSASGLFQFTDGTWRSMIKKYGGQTGIRLQDKNNPDAQKVMAQRLLDENKQILSSKLQRDPSGGELYIAHFMGPSQAARLIASPQNKIAAALFQREAASNRPIFYQKGGRPRTVAEVIELLSSKVA